jgi:hypothetical protein
MLPHAIDSLIERDANERDVYEVLTRAEDCRAADPNPRTGQERFRLAGLDRGGEPLQLIAEIIGVALVVTLFRGDEP